MITWVLLALLVYLMAAISSVIDKVLRGKYIRNSYTLTIINAVIDLAVAIVMIAIRPSVLSIPNQAIIIFAGALSSIGGLLYYSALSKGEVSRVVPLYSFIPIFSLLLAFVFLGQSLTYAEMFAFIFIVLGGFLISVKRVRGIFRLGKSFWLAILSSLIYALSFVIIRYGLQSSGFYSVQVFVQIGMFASLAVVVPFALRYGNIRSSQIRSLPKALAITGFNEIFYTTGTRLLLNIVLLAAPVAIVTALGGFQSVFVLLIAVALSMRLPNILKEKISTKIMLIKAAALVLMFVGIAILAYS